jgi:hypothetical protein
MFVPAKQMLSAGTHCFSSDSNFYNGVLLQYCSITRVRVRYRITASCTLNMLGSVTAVAVHLLLCAAEDVTIRL